VALEKELSVRRPFARTADETESLYDLSDLLLSLYERRFADVHETLERLDGERRAESEAAWRVDD